MLRSLLSNVMGGRRGGRTAGVGARPAGGTSTDAAVGRGVRGLLSRLTRR
ncbi:hypothetical protein [uncultured Nocardioides sp.]|nr:hypothetical protein [uncultured Nocardioides sp.]